LQNLKKSAARLPVNAADKAETFRRAVSFNAFQGITKNRVKIYFKELTFS